MSGKKPKRDKAAAAESASSEISECKYAKIICSIFDFLWLLI
jgi:hypothetical protein